MKRKSPPWGGLFSFRVSGNAARSSSLISRVDLGHAAQVIGIGFRAQLDHQAQVVGRVGVGQGVLVVISP
jgi:hypothetical protein